MVLDTAGGPSWSGNYVDVGILVNATSQEILLQPAYFALGHFSRFVVPGSRRVSVTGSPRGLDYIAFLTPDDQIVVVLHNKYALSNTEGSAASLDSKTSLLKRIPALGTSSIPCLGMTLKRKSTHLGYEDRPISAIPSRKNSSTRRVPLIDQVKVYVEKID